MEFIGKYRNGNYITTIFSDGTKIRSTLEDDFKPVFAENCDVKITDKCTGSNCPYCYEGCTPDGKHGDIMNPKFLDTLHPYTEMAINGNDLTHPNIIPFLNKLKEKKVIANITVNQTHFEKEQSFIGSLINAGLVHGLGISLRKATPEFIRKVKLYDNAVIHVINGIFSEEDISLLSNNNLKLLILGYKDLRRGNTYLKDNREIVEKNQLMLKRMLPSIINKFKVVSFDNLAIEQLDVKRLMTDEEWEEFFMGQDAQFTFYIDLVKGEFAGSSLAAERFPLMDNIDDMFNKVRGAVHE